MPGKKHQNPDWVRRCVASYIHQGDKRKQKAPGDLDRDEVSRAFAICRAQYNKFDNAGAKNKEARKESGSKRRSQQYKKLLAAVRKHAPG